MHPFDIKQALLAKHAQHVVLIHFPIALCMAGVAFDLAAQWTKNRTLAVAAYYNFTVAAASVVQPSVSASSVSAMPGPSSVKWSLTPARPLADLTIS